MQTNMSSVKHEFLSRLLKQSILTLCKEACPFQQRLEVDGIVCLVIDSTEQHVIKIHEHIDKDQEPESFTNEHIDTRNSSPCLSVPYENREPRADTPARDMSAYSSNMVTNVNRNSIEIKEYESEIDSKSGQTDRNITEPNGSVTSGDSINNNNVLTSSYQRIGLERLTLSTAKNILCKKCSKVLDNVGLFEAHNIQAHGHFTCLICLATFTSRNNMKRHIRLHTGIKPYTCHKCSESFSRNDDFKRHLLKHTFQKPFRCAVCKAGFADRAMIKTHMLKEHDTKTFYICQQCGETYIDLQEFQQHRRCHPEFNDYRCSICSFTGSNALMYNKHMLTHGPPKKYACNHCGIIFPDPFTYTGHLKKHKGDELVQSYVCCFCDTSLPTFEQFQRHEHTHIHCKQHVCTQCDKVFRYPSNLREHMLTHMPKIDLLAGLNKPHTSTASSDITGVKPNSHANLIASLNKMPNKSEVVSMAVEENNNHVVGDKREREVDTEGSHLADDTSGSSEYWCTECNHGFGTESELQSHIEQKHESNQEYMHDSEESSRDVSVDMETTDTYNYMLLDDDSRPQHASGMVSSHDPDNTDLKSSRLSGIQNVDEILRMKSRHIIYDEDTVVDQDKLNDRGRVIGKHPNIPPGYSSNMTETELRSVNDAMKQVHKIQSKFEIKPSEVDAMPTYTLESDKDISNKVLNLSKQSSSDKMDVDNQSMPLMSVTMKGMKMKIQRGTTSTESKTSEDNKNDNKGDANTNGAVKSDTKTASSPNSSLFEQYSKTSVLGMDTEFSESPNRSTATKINLKIRNPGFERVVTPEILFKTKAPFTCEVCQETFENFDLFHDHGVRVHRRFICSYCGKVFTSRPNRERHVRYHTGEKPYKCDLCPASFLRGDDLKYHRTTKHADVKPFTCGACQTSFALPKDLEKHLKIYPDHKL